MKALRQLAPYAVIELILPGGSLIALALWLYRRYWKRRAAEPGPAVGCWSATAHEGG